VEPILAIRLKPGEQDRLLSGHAWIFQNELEGWPPDAAPGDLVDLHDSQGHFLGRGYLNPRTTLAVRVLARGRVPVDQEFFLARIRQAMAWGKGLMGGRVAYRVVPGEADGLPGLVVDRYDDAVAIQLLTAGMDRRRELILTAVEEVLRPRTIVARNDSPMREREGLPRERAVLRGQIPPDPTVTIHGLDVVVDLLEGQKTGPFLDQIDNYPLIERMPEALAGYKEINLRAMRLLRPGAFLVTCSCSYHLSAELFRRMLWDAARDVRRTVRLVARGQQGRDHPILLGLTESEYLKCCVLQVL